MKTIQDKTPGVYLIAPRAMHTIEEDLCNQPSIDCYYIDGNAINSESTLFAEFGRKLQFFETWGKNWNAFYDCLISFNISKGDVALIIFENFEYFATENLNDFRTACDIFQDAARRIAHNLKCYYILVGSEEDIPEDIHVDQLI